jgi:D-alanyl-D-alanine-carboxypeptidase/D-alanyl-D-alanine-endopeptidase
MRITNGLFLCLTAFATAAYPLAGSVQDKPASVSEIDTEIKAALRNRIDTAKNSVGIVVGILSPEGRRYIVHGQTSKSGGFEPGPETMFEIGSISKVFTSLLLADMVEAGMLNIDDPVDRFLPQGVTAPTRNGKKITLADLATHTSGLPRDPTNMDGNALNPYATYGPKQLYAFLSGYALRRDPGERFEYSNLGAFLLAHVLTLRAGESYEELVRTRIFRPLGMNSTTLTLSSDQRARLAMGHDGLALDPVPLWDVDALPGAGSIRSTASDMLTFAAACLGLSDHKLAPAMKRMLSITRPGSTTSMDMHLGWSETRNGVLFHNGRRGGLSAALAIHPWTRQAVIVFSNSVQSVDDIAFHAVVPQLPLLKFEPPKVRTEISLETGALQELVGTYEFAPGVSIEVTREGTRLFGQVTGQPRFEMFAEKESEFFVKLVDAQVTFVKDENSAIVALVLHQNRIPPQTARRVR